jgi:hypothetical protein
MGGPHQPGRSTLPDTSFPSHRVDGMPCRPGVGQERFSPRLPLSCRGCRLGGKDGQDSSYFTTCQHPLLQRRPLLGQHGQRWPDVLYERCVDSGLRARVTIRHQTGSQEITISCGIIALSTDAIDPVIGGRRRCRRRWAQTKATASTRAPQPDITLEHPPSPREAPFPVATSPPTAAATFPPAKRTSKATKRRCEVELLRDDDIEEIEDIDDLHVSCTSRTCSERALEANTICQLLIHRGHRRLLHPCFLLGHHRHRLL